MKNSIRYKFTLGLITVISVVVLLFSAVLIIINSLSVEKQLHSQLTKITKISNQSLSIALWQYNNDYIKEYIDSLFLYEDIVFARVVVKDKEIAKKTRLEFKGLLFADFRKPEKYITAEETVSYKGVNVGTLQLVVSKGRILNLVISASSISILVVIIVNLAVLGLYYLMSNRYLFKPLAQLEGSVKAISDGKLDVKIDTNSKDEIGKLAQSFDQMMINLKRITASRDELNHEIKERIRAEERIEGLNHLKENLLGSDPLSQKLQMITDGVVDILDADFARIWLTQEGGRCNSECIHNTLTGDDSVCKDREKCLHLVASSGRYTHLNGAHARVPLGSYKIGKIASDHKPKYLTNDVVNDPLVHNQEWARKLNLVSFAGYRLVSAGGETIGVLGLFCKHELSNKDDTLL